MKKICLLLVGVLALFSCEQEELGDFIDNDLTQLQTRAASSIVWGIERSGFLMVGENGRKALKTKGFRHGRENGLNISKRFFSLHGLTSALRLRGFSADLRAIALHGACRWG